MGKLRRLCSKTKATQLTVDGLIVGMRDDPNLAGAFKGSGSAGGGTPPADGGEGNTIANGGGNLNGSGFPDRRSDMTTKQKVDFIKEHGDDTYQALQY